MENTQGISKNAVLINLNIRTWAANVMDKAVSQEVATSHGTDQKMGRFWKTLVKKGTNTPLGAIYAVERAARSFHYQNTLPWMHDGLRILPTPNYQLYMSKMREFKQELDIAVSHFVNHYETAKAESRDNLKTLYREDDYPSRTIVSRRFGLEVSVLPMPKSDTFVDSNLSDIEIERIKRELEADMAITFQRANEDLWTRLYDCVVHTQTRLSGAPGHLREAMMANVNELVDLLPRLNVNNDERLEKLRVQLKETFSGMTTEGLRQDAGARSKVADEVGAIESMMAGFMGVRPAQKLGMKRAA